jgi:hypothetical protein
MTAGHRPPLAQRGGPKPKLGLQRLDDRVELFEDLVAGVRSAGLDRREALAGDAERARQVGAAEVSPAAGIADGAAEGAQLPMVGGW